MEYHLIRIVNDELHVGLKTSRLTHDHVQLTPYPVMNVNMAAQVLSNSVANILRTYYPPETHGTAMLCDLMDQFWYKKVEAFLGALSTCK